MNMIDPEPPKPGVLETAFVLLKTAALAVVTGGDPSSFADALIHFMQLPISRRHDEWLKQMAEAGAKKK